MSDKPGKPGESAGKTPETERDRERRPSSAEEAPGKGQKKKPGDAARKMREMFKG
ncbi:hypothetical protein [Actinomadura sp. B10D3]|uniref:hypothetical protein n=1 Tax=Actinomadura sp. B10D3 TaxID=3153557 RepID=UPI00325CC9EC